MKVLVSGASLTSMRKCVSASGSPPGLPACPACLCESLMMFRAEGARASCSFLPLEAADRKNVLRLLSTGVKEVGADVDGLSRCHEAWSS